MPCAVCRSCCWRAAALLLAAAVPARAGVTSELCPSCGAGWVLTYEHPRQPRNAGRGPLRPRRGRAGRHRAHQVAACARLHQLRLAGFWRTLRHYGRSLPAGHSRPAVAEGTAAVPALSGAGLAERAARTGAGRRAAGRPVHGGRGRGATVTSCAITPPMPTGTTRPQGRRYPRAVGSYTWQCAGYETDIRTLPFAQNWVAARPAGGGRRLRHGRAGLGPARREPVRRVPPQQRPVHPCHAARRHAGPRRRAPNSSIRISMTRTATCCTASGATTPVTGSELEMEPCGAWIAEAELDALISHLEAQAADSACRCVSPPRRLLKRHPYSFLSQCRGVRSRSSRRAAQLRHWTPFSLRDPGAENREKSLHFPLRCAIHSYCSMMFVWKVGRQVRFLFVISEKGRLPWQKPTHQAPGRRGRRGGSAGAPGRGGHGPAPGGTCALKKKVRDLVPARSHRPRRTAGHRHLRGGLPRDRPRCSTRRTRSTRAITLEVGSPGLGRRLTRPGAFRGPDRPEMRRAP